LILLDTSLFKLRFSVIVMHYWLPVQLLPRTQGFGHNIVKML